MIYSKQTSGIIYLTTHEKIIDDNFKALQLNLMKLDLVEETHYRKRNKFKERVGIEHYKDITEFKKIKQNFNKCSAIFIYPWNPYSLYTISNYLFEKAGVVNLVEDGSNLYLYPKPSKFKLLAKKYLYNNHSNFHAENKVESILVQFPEKYPNHLNSKLRELKLNKMFSNLTKSSKEKIVGAFVDDNELSILEKINTTNSVIILTQPLSEDGYCNEVEKKVLYKKMVTNYSSKGYKIILKKHPREKTNYNFQDVLELDGKFPSEIFSMLEIMFNKAIGVCTSAIYQIDAKEKFNTDEEFLSRKGVIK